MDISKFDTAKLKSELGKLTVEGVCTAIKNVPKGAVIFGTLALLQVAASKVLLSRSGGKALQGSQPLRDHWMEREGEHGWLEEVEGASAMNWVKNRNSITFSALGNPQDSDNFDPTLDILNSKEKIPHISKINDYYYNFWMDEKNQRGLFRRTTLLSFKGKNPKWETVLDIDELGRREEKSWVYKGYSLYKPLDKSQCSRIILKLSNGGADATVCREFDILEKSFVKDGFCLEEAKSYVSWKDLDTLLVGTDFGDGQSLTESGYPRQCREWKRGTPLASAKLIRECDVSDIGVSGYVTKHRGHRHQFIHTSLTFYTNSLLIKLPMGTYVDVPKPTDASVSVFADKFLISLRSDWTLTNKANTTFTLGSLLAVDINDLINNRDEAAFDVLFQPTDRCFLESYTQTQNYVVLELLDNVLSKLEFWKCGDAGTWTKKREELVPQVRGIHFRAVDEDVNDYMWMTSYSFTQATTLSLVNANLGSSCLETDKNKPLKSLPQMFDATGLEEKQFEATSSDGTKIPYFVVCRKDMKCDGSQPTILYGYGGFEISMTPSYAAVVGKLWLEKGGVYVVANIRGGGEFGPKWHQAALKENRKLAYDDFIAVAEDLIKVRNITRPDRLAIRGGSNGGLLMGNMIVRRPDLWGAVICQVPLLDMRRFNKLLAGALWTAEYGNPDLEEDWAFLQQYSAYHNISKDTQYPKLLMTTSTKDDRVHPYHARSFVKRLLEVEAARSGKSEDEIKKTVSTSGETSDNVFYYENIEGGHGGAADNKQQAFNQVMVYDFLWNTLVKD